MSDSRLHNSARNTNQNLWLLSLAVVSALILFPHVVSAQVVASDMVGSASQNLTSHTNPYDGAFASAGDGFQKYQRGVSSTIPFSVLDDSLSIFTGDTLGIIKEGNTDVFFGVTDTVNGDNSGPVSATWVFDISGAASGLELSIDMGAMGDFESSDFFEWTYSIDGGAAATAFASSVDEADSNTYALEGGASVTLNDPMLMQGTILTNNLQTFVAPLVGTGSQLTLTLTASTDGGSEAFAFQNIVIAVAGTGSGDIAFDMVGSASQNLTSHTNPYDGAFASTGDGFQKYQRFVSPSIPFSVLDDSLSIFPGDSLGIITEGNTDVFFGVTDTVNGDNSGDVSATWVFDISGAASALELSIDMGAMGDFESSDFFEWTYSIDGGAAATAFASSVDEAGSNTYTLEGGTSFTLNDPMLMQGTILTNNLQPFVSQLAGTGSQLTLILTANTNGGTEAFAFQNIVVRPGSGPPPTPEVEIFEIQGAGAASPFDGSVVTTLNNVVTALAPNGFFMQTPASRTDFDVDTSDGIFVFTGGPPSVAVGDAVDVTGQVDEFFGFTEITNSPTVTIVGSESLPFAVNFDTAVPSPDPTTPSCAIEYECYEGMLVEIVDGTITGPNQRFNPDPIAEAHIVAYPQRSFREPGIEFPGLTGLPLWDGNPEVFELDPDKLGLPNQILPAGSSFSAVGVVGYEFGGYELWPSQLNVSPVPLPRPVWPREPGEYTVATLNLFRLFDDVDDPPDAQGGQNRDDFVVSTAEYTRRLAKFSAHIREVLDAPDILAVQEAEKLGVLEDLAAQIATDEPGISYTAFLVEGNDVGTIDVGFMVRSRINVDAITQLGKDEIFAFDGSLLHDRPPLLLEGSCQLEFGTSPIAVLVVHNRSLGGIDSPSDGDRVRRKRFQQAESIAGMVQDLQITDPDVRLVVAGDFNAFEFSDGYVDVVGIIKGDFVPADSLICADLTCTDLVEPDFTDEILNLPPGERYSFIFRGSAQVLDHALTSSGLSPEISALAFGRGNADAALDLINEDGIPLRASDHDGLVLYILNDEDADGVPNDLDVCPGTAIPESVPTVELGTNRWALVDTDGIFDTNLPNGNGAGLDRGFTLADTAGCSCEQIIDELHLGRGHSKFGCSTGVMETWIQEVQP